MILKRLRRGVYRVGRYEVWHEARNYWRLWDHLPSGSLFQHGGYRTCAEAVEAARREQQAEPLSQ